MLNRIILYCMENTIVPILLVVGCLLWGTSVAPFDIAPSWLPKDSIAVDAIPDIGENQQVVFTEWAGQSPEDIDDQVTYPLVSSLLGLPGVKSIRSSSTFGMSNIYVIFEDDVEFYWSRSRIVEKLNSLPQGLLPTGVTPALGPDATGLGQIFWYTLEGRDPEGNPIGGWDLQELRAIQDFQVQYALNAVDGVSEVSSIGGHVASYQVEVDPDALHAYGLGIQTVADAVRRSNRDVGAKTLEINQVEYFIRGLGKIEVIEDLESIVLTVRDNVPILLQDVARVSLTPSLRRGVLDKAGVEAVGGVVVARYGANPMQVIDAVKTQIEAVSVGLPQRILADGTVSKVTIVPFYDRSVLIEETLGTLRSALSLELLVTGLVVLLMLSNLPASIVVSSMLPLSVLLVFIFMKFWGVEANIVALSGIAIAIGTMVDLGIVLLENVLRHEKSSPVESIRSRVYEAASEVSAPILTTIATTIISFVPIFWLESAEGKLFGPLAFTKTASLVSALFVVLFIIPTLAMAILKLKNGLRLSNDNHRRIVIGLSVLMLFYWLGAAWMPVPSHSLLINLLMATSLVSIFLGGFYILRHNYRTLLGWCLENKGVFMLLPSGCMVLAITIWMGFSAIVKPIEGVFGHTSIYRSLSKTFPGIGSEFMPALDEGAFLLMPTSMMHSGVEYNTKVLSQLDAAVTSIPEVDTVIGKLGRVDSALDPAPISMYENLIQYKPEYQPSLKGGVGYFQTNPSGDFILQNGQVLSQSEIVANGLQDELVESTSGRPFRNWRPEIQSTNDIWQEIVAATRLPGITSAPKLHPIETRLVMLQTGMRAPMGLKIFGPDLDSIQQFSTAVEGLLKATSGVSPETVFADRMVAKPYLEVDIDREQLARYGLQIDDVQSILTTSVGGIEATTLIAGRERTPVMVRYPREFRDGPEMIESVLIPTSTGAQVPLSEVASIVYRRGPQQVKAEDTFLVGYVLFDKEEDVSAGEVVSSAQTLLESHIESGDIVVPIGVRYEFSGSYQQQQRAEKRLSVLIPLVLMIIVLILYLQFGSISTVLMVFGGVLMSFSGAFMLLWLYGQAWFLDIELAGIDLQSLFQIQPVYLSVAVWVGFVALFGIATDDGVLMGTQLDRFFKDRMPSDVADIRKTVIEAGETRITPAIMTSATTVLALLPVLTSTGRGSDIMIPMAIPTVGGMMVASISYFIVPVWYSWRAERQYLRTQKGVATQERGES